jgi:hypothetical protein
MEDATQVTDWRLMRRHLELAVIIRSQALVEATTPQDFVIELGRLTVAAQALQAHTPGASDD